MFTYYIMYACMIMCACMPFLQPRPCLRVIVFLPKKTLLSDGKVAVKHTKVRFFFKVTK